MVDKEYIKDIISSSVSDILFEKYIGLLDNDFDIIYEPKGLFNRGILKDTGKVYKGRDNHLFIEVNRAGLYDVMPKGLFHDKLDDLNNKGEIFDKIEKERKEIRRLFLPFDSTILSATATVEKENAKHFKNRFDSKIAFELLRFFQVFDELDFFSIIEILFFDLFRQKSYRKEDIDELILSVLPSESTYKGIITDIFEICHGDSMLIRFLDTLSYSSSFTADFSAIQRILRYIFDVKVNVANKKEIKFLQSNSFNNYLFDCSLNSTNKSFVLGNKFFDEIEIVEYHIIISNENLFLLNNFQNGSLNKLLQLFNSFFIPYHFESKLKFEHESINKNQTDVRNFFLEPISLEQWTRFIALGNNIRGSLISAMDSENWYEKSPATELRMELIDYLNLFYMFFFSQETNHTFLNMNSKI